jgi:hypothetical protein
MKKPRFYLLQRDNFGSIFIVILFAMGGYMATYLLLSNNYRHGKSDQVIRTIRNSQDNTVKEVRIDTLKMTQQKLMQQPVVIDKELVLFHRNPIFLIWSTLIIIMMTIASASFPVFIWQIRQIGNTFCLNNRHFLQAGLMALFMVFFLILMQKSVAGFYNLTKLVDNFQVLLKHGWVFRIILVSTLLLQVPVLMVLFLVGISVGKIDIEIRNRQSVKNILSRFTILNQTLIDALQVLAVVVVFTVIAVGALQQSVKSVLLVAQFDVFPKEVCYVYGMFFSLFLGIIYIPTYLFLKNRFNHFKQNIETGIETADEEKKDWYKDFTGSVNFGVSALDNLKLAFTVLAPLLSSFLPEQLRLFI